MAVGLLTSQEHKQFSEGLQGTATDVDRVLWKPLRVQGEKAARAALFFEGPHQIGLGQDWGDRKS